MSAAPTTLSEALWPRTLSRSAVRSIVLVTAGVALLAVSAQVRIPFYPVPFTMQTFVVLVVGMAYGPRLGGATVAAYLGAGAVGAPVFAGLSAGTAILSGATAGYLWGFLVAAVVVGRFAELGWDRSALRTFAAMMAGTAIIFGFGLLWLTNLFGLDVALTTGLRPFVASEAVKVGLAVATLPAAWRLLGPR